MRVMIAGGGTGGHLFPGLAVAEEFKNRDAATEVIFVGTESGIEARIVPRDGYPIRFLRAEGIVGTTLTRKIRAIFKSFLSMVDSYRIIKTIRPVIVIGVGGYASGATTLLAYFMSIPTLVLEQNSVPGLTNLILVLLLGVLGAGLWFLGRPAYRKHKEARSLNQARDYLSKGDYPNASLSARQALLLNPSNVGACQVMAEYFARFRAPRSCWTGVAGSRRFRPRWRTRYCWPPPLCAHRDLRIRWRRKRWRACRWRAGNNAPYHVVWAELALKTKRPSLAAEHFAQAVALEPGNQQHQLNLAVLRLQSTNQTQAGNSSASATITITMYTGDSE